VPASPLPGNHHAEAARVPSLADDLARANCAGLLHSGHVLQASGNDSSVKVGITDAEFLDGQVAGGQYEHRAIVLRRVADRPLVGRGGMLYAKEVDVEDCALRESCVLFITPRGEPQWSGSRGKLRDRFDDENKMEAVQAEEDCDCTGGNPSRKLAAVGYKSIIRPTARKSRQTTTTPS